MVIQLLPTVLLGDDLKRYKTAVTKYMDKGLSQTLATRLASSTALLSALDIIEVSVSHELPIEDVATVYFTIDDQLNLAWLRRTIVDKALDSRWEVLTRESLRDDLDWQQRQLTTNVLMSKSRSSDLRKRCKNWLEQYSELLKRWRDMLSELKSTKSLTFIMFFVAVRELQDLTQASTQQVMQAATENGAAKKRTKSLKVVNSKE